MSELVKSDIQRKSNNDNGNILSLYLKDQKGWTAREGEDRIIIYPTVLLPSTKVLLAYLRLSWGKADIKRMWTF